MMVVFLLSLSQSVICFMFLTSMMKFVPTWMTLEMWGSCHRDRIGIYPVGLLALIVYFCLTL